MNNVVSLWSLRILWAFLSFGALWEGVVGRGLLLGNPVPSFMIPFGTFTSWFSFRSAQVTSSVTGIVYGLLMGATIWTWQASDAVSRWVPSHSRLGPIVMERTTALTVAGVLAVMLLYVSILRLTSRSQPEGQGIPGPSKA